MQKMKSPRWPWKGHPKPKIESCVFLISLVLRTIETVANTNRCKSNRT